MAAHNTNGLLKYGIIAVVIILLLVFLLQKHHAKESGNKKLFSENTTENKANNIAVTDSAAESLDTLTAELATTKQQVEQITQDNAALKKQNDTLAKKAEGAQDAVISSLSQEVDQLKNQIQQPKSNDYPINTENSPQPINTVPDLTQAMSSKLNLNLFGNAKNLTSTANVNSNNPPKPIPYYTIPANATAVDDKLMSALVGRIPIKSVVTDPYPFKIVFSDDTLAANGLRIPNLKKMIVSGYAEGDLNLVSVRGWVTSLTFVFNDGTISTTTSNDNDIGNFTKNNALGYLSDPRGNPFLRGKLITNAPEFLAGTIGLGAAQGAASAYSQAQTTTQNSILGSATTSITGSPGKYVLGQAGVNAAGEAQQWWQDREENSFDAIYVPSGQPIVVNFAKEIDIDYNPQGRKLDYANDNNPNITRSLD